MAGKGLAKGVLRPGKLFFFRQIVSVLRASDFFFAASKLSKCFVASIFCEEFHSLINWLLTRNHNNICTCAATCMEILKTFDYTQHVKQPTHKGIHILDLIIARSKDNIVRHTSVVDLGLSDHYGTLQSTFRQLAPLEKKEIKQNKP